MFHKGGCESAPGFGEQYARIVGQDRLETCPKCGHESAGIYLDELTEGMDQPVVRLPLRFKACFAGHTGASLAPSAVMDARRIGPLD